MIYKFIIKTTKRFGFIEPVKSVAFLREMSWLSFWYLPAKFGLYEFQSFTPPILQSKFKIKIFVILFVCLHNESSLCPINVRSSNYFLLRQ
mgnify:CR=1 FL=1